MATIIAPAARRALDEALEQGRYDGLDRFQKQLLPVIEAHNLGDLFATDRPFTMRRRILFLYRWSMRAAYQAVRHDQLLEGRYPFWIYHAGNTCGQHTALDGVALPPDHPFWQSHFPANGPECDCYLSGASTESSVRRRGGDPEKLLPSGWYLVDSLTGLPWGIEAGFDSQIYPPLSECLRRLPNIE